MNTAQQESPQNQQEPPQGNGKSSACDLEEIEHLACKAKRFARQAEVMNEQEVKDLDTYRTQYAEARQKYSDARNDAKAEIDAIWKILKETGSSSNTSAGSSRAKRNACTKQPRRYSPRSINAVTTRRAVRLHATTLPKRIQRVTQMPPHWQLRSLDDERISPTWRRASSN